MDDQVTKKTERAMTIAYPLQGSLYLNITNRCPNRCLFCIRETQDGVGYNLWLEREPTSDEVIAVIGNPSNYHEVVFCGYGEPLMRPEVVIDVAQYLKPYQVPVRINTNGLSDLFLGYDVLPLLKDLIETVSISLNAHDAKSYHEITRTKYGEAAFSTILDFSRRSRLYIPKVVLSVVRHPVVDLEKAATIAQNLGVEFRIREQMG